MQRRLLATSLLLAGAAQAALHAAAAPPPVPPPPILPPWMDPARTLDARADLLTAAMTRAERLQVLRGVTAWDVPALNLHRPAGAIGSAGFVPGIPRLGIPDLNETDGSLGITNPFNTRPGDTATAYPAGQALAASFNPDLAYQLGAALGRDAASRGLNLVLAGGVNLARDPRGGRNFEYAGEDPLLAGTMVGAAVRGIASQHVIATVKHFAGNDQESQRQLYDVELSEADSRASDLLAFQLAIERGQPGAVMCAYNKWGGQYACQSPRLLTEILKGDWHFPGFVMSDWGAVHDGRAAINAGLDQESGSGLDPQPFFAAPLQRQIDQGQVSENRVNDAARRIIRAMLAAGLMDGLPRPAPDQAAALRLATAAAREAIVMLANRDQTLPLTRRLIPHLPPELQCFAVIGGQSDAGVAAGGGSSQVTPPGGYARTRELGGPEPTAFLRSAAFDGASPLARLQAKFPKVHIYWADGRYPAQAANTARFCQAAIIFADQWSGEAYDIPDLSLPDGMDATIDAVTRVNPHTVVVLETGGPIRMPWLAQAGAVLEAWYPGSGGADAIADILAGDAAPEGRLPITFPKSEDDLPQPVLEGLYLPPGTPFIRRYKEGANAGYRWFAASGKAPLFPFGFGLTYTSFAYKNLHATPGAKGGLHAEFDVTNTGAAAGVEVAQLYSLRRALTLQQHLLGWRKLHLKPGETAHVSLDADPRLLADYFAAQRLWVTPPGAVTVAAGPDAGTLAVKASVMLGLNMAAP